MSYFKFHQNRPINEKFDFFKGLGGGGARWEKGEPYLSISISINIGKHENVVSNFIKITR